MYKYTFQNIFFISLIMILCSTLLLHLFPKNSLHSISYQQHSEEYMRQVELIQFSELGHPKNQLKADYWGYIASEKKSKLVNLHLIVHKINNSIWHIDAKEGQIFHPTLHHSIDKIDLQNNVIIKRLAFGNITPLQFKTDALQYHPEKEYLETDQKVTIIHPNVILTSIGIRAFFVTNQIELLKDVKTKYTTP